MSNIDNVIARAQRLMLDEDWNRQVEMGASAQRAGSLTGKNNGGGNDLAMLEAMAFGAPAPSAPAVNYTPIPENFKMPKQNINNDNRPIQILQETKSPIDKSRSKIPAAIRESFEKMPALTGDDSYSMPPASYYAQPQAQPQQRQVVREQVMPQQAPNNGGIDYNYIKYLIDESIKSHLGNQLNESSTPNFKGMRIANGSVIQFLDTKGNLYEGKLVLKKKANS